MTAHQRPNKDRLVCAVAQIDGGTRWIYAASAATAREWRKLLDADPAGLDCPIGRSGNGTILVDQDANGRRVHTTCDCADR